MFRSGAGEEGAASHPLLFPFSTGDEPDLQHDTVVGDDTLLLHHLLLHSEHGSNGMDIPLPADCLLLVALALHHVSGSDNHNVEGYLYHEETVRV